MQAIQLPGNEAQIDALLSDLSSTDDSAEAAIKAKLLRQIVLGELPYVSLGEVKRAATRTDDLAGLQREAATLTRFSKFDFAYQMVGFAACVGGIIWVLYHRKDPEVIRVVWPVFIIPLLNVFSYLGNYRMAKFAAKIKRINVETSEGNARIR